MPVSVELNTPEEVYRYALDIAKCPFPKGEDIISENTYYSYLYATDVLRGPFPKGEDAIAKDPYYSFYYAKYALKGRFPKGEKVIKQSIWKEDYREFLESCKE